MERKFYPLPGEGNFLRGDTIIYEGERLDPKIDLGKNFEFPGRDVPLATPPLPSFSSSILFPPSPPVTSLSWDAILPSDNQGLPLSFLSTTAPPFPLLRERERGRILVHLEDSLSLPPSTLTRTQINEITREEEEEEGFHPSSGMTLAESFCPRARGTERDSESLKLCLRRDSKGRKIYSKKRAIFFYFREGGVEEVKA